VTEPGGSMKRVNFASGSHHFEGWLNVDLNDPADMHLNLLCGGWPASLEDIDVAYVGHFLEHLTLEECAIFLDRVVDRMADGSVMYVVGPDVDKVDPGDPGLRYMAGAHGERIGNDVSHIHAWDCTAAKVLDLCKRTGLVDVTEITFAQLAADGIPIISDAPWQFVVRGHRPHAL
jgi:hypothetical protein